jgi:hypothetical protein
MVLGPEDFEMLGTYYQGNETPVIQEEMFSSQKTGGWPL